jgi:hypothetical protein
VAEKWIARRSRVTPPPAIAGAIWRNTVGRTEATKSMATKRNTDAIAMAMNLLTGLKEVSELLPLARVGMAAVGTAL